MVSTDLDVTSFLPGNLITLACVVAEVCNEFPFMHTNLASLRRWSSIALARAKERVEVSEINPEISLDSGKST